MRLTALWWWIDRWRKSTAYTDMTLEEQGAYRNLLDEQWLRHGPIPNDERILAKCCGDATAWPKVRKAVLARFTLGDGGWRNETLDSVSYQSHRRAENQKKYRERNNKADNGADNTAGHNPASPSPSPSPSPDQSPEPSQDSKVKNKLVRDAGVLLKGNGNDNGGGHVNARSKHPIFKGQRFVVFDWMLEDLMRALGPHTDKFDLHEWFFTLDGRAAKSSQVIPQRDTAKWLHAQMLSEAQRRGLPIAASTKTDTVTQNNLAVAERFVKRGGSHGR